MKHAEPERLTFVLPSLAHGGAQRVFVDLVVFLKDTGHLVDLIVLDRQGELIERVESKIPVQYLDHGLALIGAFKRLIQLYRLRRLLRNSRNVKIYSTITGMNIFTIFAGLGIPGLTTVIREASSLENIQSRWLYLLAKITYRRANSIICTSGYGRDQIVTEFGISKSMTSVIPNPIDVKKIRKLANQYSPYVESLKDNPGPIVVAVGRLVKAKGFDILLEAISLVKQSQPNILMVIVGEGDEREALERQISHLRIQEHVKLVGYQSNPYPIIEMAKLFVLSSRWEGYVNVLIEAMALSKPIVATDCNSGPGQLLRTELKANLIPINNPGLLAKEIDHMLREKVLVSYQDILKEHSFEIISRDYIEA